MAGGVGRTRREPIAMNVHFAYGHDGLDVAIPDGLDVTVCETKPMPEPGEPAKIVAASLANPIGSNRLVDIAEGRESACVVISDVTRPVPNALLLPSLLREIETAGVPREKIVILVGTGIHRPNLGDELRGVVGDEVMDNYRIENHYSKKEEDQVFVGKTEAGIPVEINRFYMNADLKVVTGLIEPHMWAGFSGGRKGILPGIASVETMKHMHGYDMIADPGLGYGEVGESNPFHVAGVEVSRMVGCDFLANVVIDARRRLLGCFCGDIVEAHEKGCEFLRPYVEHEFAAPVDIVAIGGGGLPLDHVLYQSSKAMVVADAILKPEGSMVVAAGCSEGPGSPEFADLLDKVESVDQFMAMLREPGFFEVDQWVAQQIYEIRRRHEIFYHTDGIDAERLRRYLMTPVESVEAGLRRCAEKHGAGAKVAVFPEGPYVYGRLTG